MSNLDAPLIGLVQEGPPAPAEPAPPPLRLDFGAGPNCREGFEGVDRLSFGGKVKHVVDLVAGEWTQPVEFVGGVARDAGERYWKHKPWPWADSSVAEAHASHFLEHLTNFGGLWQRVHFFNELYRVLVPGGQCQLIVPHWCSNRYYGDPTHKEPYSEMSFYYLLRSWRLGDPDRGVPGNAPHADASHNPEGGYSCDFDATWGYSMHGQIALRAQEAQQFALAFYKEAAQDLIGTITARKG